MSTYVDISVKAANLIRCELGGNISASNPSNSRDFFMKNTFSRTFVHLSWHTKDNLSLITPVRKKELTRYICHKARECGSSVLAINMIFNHLHLLAHLPLTMSIASLAKLLKGSSSHFIHVIEKEKLFEWQVGYGAVTVSERVIPEVIDYIKNQALHHHCG